MIRIAIVEDERDAAKHLQKLLEKLLPELQQNCDVACFENAEDFLTVQRGRFDLVFLDIQMPGINGIEAAAKLRETDRASVLAFVSSLAQFAPEGYALDAAAFLVKPVDEASLSLCLRRAIKQLSSRDEKKIMITVNGVRHYIPVSEIYYAEVSNHQLVYYTTSGEYSTYDSMSKIEKELGGLGFARCNSCYLINLRHVSSVDKFTVYVHGTALQISHPRKKAFMDALNQHISG